MFWTIVEAILFVIVGIPLIICAACWLIILLFGGSSRDKYNDIRLEKHDEED